MTVIVGLVDQHTVYIGGDAALTTDFIKYPIREAKVFRHDNLIMGVAGLPRALQLLRYSFTPPEHSPRLSVESYLATVFAAALDACFDTVGHRKDDRDEEHPTLLLLGYQGRLFCIEPTYVALEAASGYMAIGSGTEPALGALYATRDSGFAPRERVQLALEAAACHSRGVMEPFTIEVLE